MSNTNNTNNIKFLIANIDDLDLDVIENAVEAEFPHACPECGGTGWLGDVGDEWGDACSECTERGVDPLNINLKLLEGGVSPTAGVNLFDPTRPPCTLRDVLTLKEVKLWGHPAKKPKWADE